MGGSLSFTPFRTYREWPVYEDRLRLEGVFDVPLVLQVSSLSRSNPRSLLV